MDEKRRSSSWKPLEMGQAITSQFPIMRLYKDWDQVLGSVMSQHMKLVNIAPPTIYVEVPHAMWKQEVQMKSRTILQLLELYYQKRLITDIQVRIVGDDFQKGHPIEEEDPFMPEEGHSVDHIELKAELLERIDASLAGVQHDRLREVMRQARIGQAKKYYALRQEGKRICPHCHVWISDDGPCSLCAEKEREAKRQRIRNILRDHPHYKWDEVRRIDPTVTMNEYLSVNKEWIHYYLDRLYKGSMLDYDMYQLAMLILKQEKDTITKEHVANLTNKYRKKNQQMKVKI